MSHPKIKDGSTSCSTARLKLDKGLQCLKNKQWREAQENFYQVLESAQEFMQCYVNHQHTLPMVEILNDTGQQFSRLMDYSTAITCYNSAMCLIIGCESPRQERIAAMCRAFSCLVNTFLFIKDIDSAVTMMSQYKGFLLDVEFQHEDIRLTLGNVLLEVGLAQLENTMCNSARSTLEDARGHLMRVAGVEHKPRQAKLLSSLGYCYLCVGHEHASDYLLEALDLWQKLKYPLDECETIVNTMKHFIEALLCSKNSHDSSGNGDRDVCKTMVRFHNALSKNGFGMLVANAFIYLGMVAYNRVNEAKAVSYFEQALALYRQAPSSESNREEVCKLLRYIGVSSYNCRHYQKAAEAYQECLDMLQSSQSSPLAKVSYVAECCAALGFSYSRLRNFSSMLKYYEKALELRTHLAPEDLELIETNIGSLYQVKAVVHLKKGDKFMAEKYYTLAENAFTKALRYSWKSFPFINYGYYLLCRGHFTAAAHTLQQAYLNGVIDKDTVEFDHTEDPILLDDLRAELEGREDIRMPAPIIALYLKALAQAKMGNLVGAKSTAGQLLQEVMSAKYECFYVLGFGLDRMKALCYSLLAYTYRTLGCNVQAYSAFQSAIAILPDYPAAKKNLLAHRSAIVSKTGK